MTVSASKLRSVRTLYVGADAGISIQVYTFRVFLVTYHPPPITKVNDRVRVSYSLNRRARHEISLKSVSLLEPVSVRECREGAGPALSPGSCLKPSDVARKVKMN